MVRCPGSGNCASQIRPSAVHSGEAIRTVSNLCCYFKNLKTKHANMSYIMFNFNTSALCFSFWGLLYLCILCCFPYNVRKRRKRQTDRQTENKDKYRLKYIWIHIFLSLSLSLFFFLSLFLGFSLSRTFYGKQHRINRYKYS